MLAQSTYVCIVYTIRTYIYIYSSKRLKCACDIRTYVCTFVHKLCTIAHMYICIYVNVYMYVCVYIHTRVCTYVCSKWVHTCTNIHTHIAPLPSALYRESPIICESHVKASSGRDEIGSCICSRMKRVSSLLLLSDATTASERNSFC